MSAAIFSISKSSIWLYLFLFFKSSWSFSWVLLFGGVSFLHGFCSSYILNYFKHACFYLYYPEFFYLKFLIVYYCCLLCLLTLTGGILFSLCFVILYCELFSTLQNSTAGNFVLSGLREFLQRSFTFTLPNAQGFHNLTPLSC